MLINKCVIVTIKNFRNILKRYLKRQLYLYCQKARRCDLHVDQVVLVQSPFTSKLSSGEPLSTPGISTMAKLCGHKSVIWIFWWESYEMSPIGERNIAYPILKILKISLSALGCYYRYQMNIDTQVVFLIKMFSSQQYFESQH